MQSVRDLRHERLPLLVLLALPVQGEPSRLVDRQDRGRQQHQVAGYGEDQLALILEFMDRHAATLQRITIEVRKADDMMIDALVTAVLVATAPAMAP